MFMYTSIQKSIAKVILFIGAVAVISTPSLISTLPQVEEQDKTTYIIENSVKSSNRTPEEAASYPASLFDNSYSTRSHISKVLTQTQEVNNIITTEDNIIASDIPVNYTEMQIPFSKYPVYAFINDQGKTEYRVYAVKHSENGSRNGFVRADVSFENGKIRVIYDLETPFVEYDSEKFGEIEAVDPPANITSGLIKVYGKTGLYMMYKKNQEKQYIIYGHYPGGENEFYLADKKAQMIKGTFPIERNT